MYSLSLAHTKWKCQYHTVLIPKYHRRVLYGRLKRDIRKILKKLCEYKKVEIIEGAVCKDLVYICVAIPPKMSVSDFVGYLKGNSALMVFDKHPELGNKWDRTFWAKGYYVSTVGNITEDAIKSIFRNKKKKTKEKKQGETR